MKTNHGGNEASEAKLDMIELQAAAWLARRDRGLRPEEAVEFALWRAADLRHEAAVRDLDAMWEALDDLSALKGEVVDFPAQAQPGRLTKIRGQRRMWLPWAMAAAAGFAVIAGVALWPAARTVETAVTAVHYETAVGDQRTITLTDGSTVRLNTDSAVDVRYTEGERRVVLARGEAHFMVTKNAARPFIVAAEGAEARALGTAFIVRRRDKDTELVVTEGRVKFSAVADATAAVEVGAGQAAVCDPKNLQAMRAEPLDQAALARRLAWENNRLVCRLGMPLAEVAAEFNRYNRQKLVLQDAKTQAVAMGGGFELTNLEALVKRLETDYEIVVVERTAERIELKSKR